MSELPALTGDVEELDGRGHCAIPGLVDCHTHPAFGGRPRRGVLAARRRRELRGAARGRRRDPLDRPRHARGGRGGADGGGRAAPQLDAPRRHDHVRGQVGLRARPRDRARVSSARCARPAAIPTWLGAHATPPEFDDADAYLDFALAEVLPEAARLAEAADVFLERGAFDARAGAPLPRGVRRAGARAPSARRPVHRGRSDPARDRARRAVGRPSRGDRPGRDRRARGERRHGRAAARERALPRPADAAGARARRRRRRRRARDRLQPRQRLLREPPARLLARRDAAPARARRRRSPRAR